MINVSRVVLNPKFLQPVTRTIRKEFVNQFGEPDLSAKVSTIMVVVTVASPKDLARFEDLTQYKDAIKVTGHHKLNPDVIGQQADIITWHNQHYIVASSSDYKENGFCRAICRMIDFQDQASNR